MRNPIRRNPLGMKQFSDNYFSVGRKRAYPTSLETRIIQRAVLHNIFQEKKAIHQLALLKIIVFVPTRIRARVGDCSLLRAFSRGQRRSTKKHKGKLSEEASEFDGSRCGVP